MSEILRQRIAKTRRLLYIKWNSCEGILSENYRTTITPKHLWESSSINPEELMSITVIVEQRSWGYWTRTWNTVRPNRHD